MISCANFGVSWGPALQVNGNILRSSSCGIVVDSHGSTGALFSHPSRRKPAREVSCIDLYFGNFKSKRCLSLKNGSLFSSQSSQYHQSRRIELRRFRVILQNGELRFKKSTKAGYAEAESGDTATQLAVTMTRRDVLVRTSSAAVAIANVLGGKAAQASVSKRVRLKDVDDQKLQQALRAAVAGDLENAETLFTEIIKEEPTSASGWSNRGSVRVSLGKYELATGDFTKAIELAPEAPVPYLNRAISYEALGRYEEAITDCKTAIENDPEEPAAWFNLGNVEARMKDFESSLDAYQRASYLAPGIAGYRLRQALILFQVGRVEEAKKLMQGLVRKYPNYTEAHAALAALLWSEGQRTSAEEQFSEATNREPLYSKINWVTNELGWPPQWLKPLQSF